MKHITRSQQGYTLIELMITAAVIGILSAIAIPSYRNYIATTCLATAEMNLITLRAYQENYALEYNTYLPGTVTATTNPFKTTLRWEPDDKGEFTYVVSAGSTGIGTSYQVTVTGQKACAGASITGG